MTLRITLLVLVTGLFALIWTHDQRPIKHPAPPIAAVDSQENDQTVPVMTAQKQSKRLSVETERPRPAWLDIELARYTRSDAVRNDSKIELSAMTAAFRKVAPQQTWKLGDTEMPYPAGLVPGEYRAVSNTGIVRDLTVTLADLQARPSGQSEFTTRDVYRSQGKKLRWFFVRVQTESGKTFPVIVQRGTHVIRPAVAPRGTHKHRPAVAQKDRSRELRQQASQIIVGVGQRFFQNVAKSLRDEGDQGWDSVQEQIQPTKLTTEETEANSL